MKNNEFIKLLSEMSKCQCCTNLKEKALVNFYGDEMCKNIPSIWTDWFKRLDSEIMIIGQDWGPFSDMEKLYKRYMSGESYDDIVDSEKSLTKKNLFKFLKMSNSKCDFSKIYITNAIMCARMGNTYRGDNINLKYSTISCSKYLKEQINIVKPKVILTLGYFPLLSISKIFNFEINDSLTKQIEDFPIIEFPECVIIPVFHPVAQVKTEKQLEQYRKIWRYL